MTQQHKHRLHIQSFRRRLISTITVVILVIGATIVWLKSGQEPLATALSIIFVAVAVIIGFLQWLLPMSSDHSSPPQTFHPQKMDNKIPMHTAQHQQEETHQSSTPQEPPFDEALLLQPARFVGRAEDLHWLLKQLQKGGVTGITAATRGMGGIGKTTLAAVAVHQLRAEGRFQDGIGGCTMPGVDRYNRDLTARISSL